MAAIARRFYREGRRTDYTPPCYGRDIRENPTAQELTDPGQTSTFDLLVRSREPDDLPTVTDSDQQDALVSCAMRQHAEVA